MTLSHELTGSQIFVQGTIGSLSLGAPPCGIFSLETGSPSTFVPQPSANDTKYNQTFYASPPIEAGIHTLTLRIDTSTESCGLGQPKLWPIWIDYLQYTPTELAAGLASSPSSSLPSSTSVPTATPASNAKVSVGAIIGGSVVGGVVFLAILGALICCRRRRNTHRDPSPEQASSGECTVAPVDPS